MEKVLIELLKRTKEIKLQKAVERMRKTYAQIELQKATRRTRMIDPPKTIKMSKYNR